MFVEGQIGHELLECEVFFFQLAQTPQLGDAHTGELFLPAVEGLLADAELAADVGDRRTGLGLAERVGDLLLSKGGLLHLAPP